MTSRLTLRLLDRLADKQQQQLSDSFAEKHKMMAACTREMAQTMTALRARGWRTHENVWNACLFINLVAYDLSLVISDLAFERDEWRRRYYARSLALLLYEVANDIPSVLGKHFQQALGKLGVSDQRVTDLRAAQKSVSDFWDANHNLLKEIRRVSAAHRDHDAMMQLNVIESMDLLALLGLGLELGNRLNELGTRAQSIMTQASSCRPPES